MGSTRRAASPRTLNVCLGALLALVPLTATAQDGLPGGPPQSPYAQGLSYTGAGTAPTTPAAPAATPAEVTHEYADGLVIRGSEEFVNTTRAALDALGGLDSGKQVIANIGESGRTTTITETGVANGYASWADREAATPNADGTPGAGSDATVQWNPNFGPGDMPSEVILAHELIHAMHINDGVLDLDRVEDATSPDHRILIEELKTVGIPPHAGEDNPLTENAVREDWNEEHDTDIPVRETYAPHSWSPTGLYTPGERAEYERQERERQEREERDRRQQQQPPPDAAGPGGKPPAEGAAKGAAKHLEELFGGGR